MRQIEMVDLKKQYFRLKDDIDSGISKVLASSAFVKGPMVKMFEEHLQDYLGVKHVIGVGNGTDALQIALMALGLKPGDEVITPTFTFISTVEVVSLLGLTPVLVDVEPDTFTLSLDAVSRAITPRTRAIVPVHLFGQNADMESLLAIARAHHLYVVEDACQSIASRYYFGDGSCSMSGCMGQIGCTSFFPSKNLGCYGDGGALFTNDDDLASTIRSIANHGMQVRYHHDCIGLNSRLDSIQAAVLEVKLAALDDSIMRRRNAATFYDKSFMSCTFITIPIVNPQSDHVYHQYTIQVNGVDRDLLRDKLQANSIPSMVYYPIPIHQQKAYLDDRNESSHFPNAERLSKCVLSLPMHTELDEEQLTYIVDHVLRAIDELHNKK